MRLQSGQPTLPKIIPKFLFLSIVPSVPQTKLNLIEHRNSTIGAVLIQELVLINEHLLDFFLEMSKFKERLEQSVNMPEQDGHYINFILMEPQTHPIAKRLIIARIVKELIL